MRRTIDKNDKIFKIVKELIKLQEKAKALGIFTGDRELLECSKCGLMEDVDFRACEEINWSFSLVFLSDFCVASLLHSSILLCTRGCALNSDKNPA